MSKPRSPLFVQRAIYRRRRLMDAARLLPVVGLVLILLPMMWSREGGQGIAAEAIYLFALWAALVLVAAVMAGPLRRGPAQPGDPPRHAGRPELAPQPDADRATGAQVGAQTGNASGLAGGGNPGSDTPEHRQSAAPQSSETSPGQPPAPPPPGGRA